MCFCVFLASDHPLPTLEPPPDGRGFNARPLPGDHPVRRWLSRPYAVYLGSRTWCACGLNFRLNEFVELDETPEFTSEFTPEIWEAEAQEYRLDKKCVEDYFAYLTAASAPGNLEWYCCWDGDWHKPPVRRLLLPASSLAIEPDFQKDYPLEEGLYILFDPNA